MYQTHAERKPPSAWRYLWRSEDIRRKILVTAGLVLLYRVLLNIPIPGFSGFTDTSAPSNGSAFTLIEFIDMLSGGGLLRTSILGLGLLPFSIAGQLLEFLIPVVPSLQRRIEESPSEGRRFLDRWQNFLAVPIGFLEAWLFIGFVEMNCNGVKFIDLGANLDLLSKISIAVIMIAGSFFAVWIGSLISIYGIRGQGLSILILSGIVGAIPTQIVELLALPDVVKDLIIYVVIIVGSIITVVYLQSGRRNVPVAYPGRRMGTRMSTPVTATLPLMVNVGGTQGFVGSQLIVALATFYAPLASCSSIGWINTLAVVTMSIFSESSFLFGPVAFLSVFLFTMFYNDVLFQQQNYGENLKRAGAMIPGVDRGASTQRYLNRINRRISFVGSLVMAFLAITPWLANLVAGTSLPILDGERTVIMVGVIRDVFMTVDAELKLLGYQDNLLIH